MKNKFLFGASLILLFLVVLFTQIYIIGGKTLFGIKPNIILISTIVFASFVGLYKGTYYALFVGVLCDFIYGSNFGVFTLSYVVVAIIIGLIESNYRKENKTTLIIMTFLGTACFEVVQCLIYSIMLSDIMNIFFLIKQVIMASILNMVIVWILNGIVQKIAEYFKIKSKERDALY